MWPEFVYLIRVIFGKRDFNFNLEIFRGRASLTAEPTLIFTIFYQERAGDVAASPAELQPETNEVVSPAEL